MAGLQTQHGVALPFFANLCLACTLLN
jgi:hypothetical protein